MERFQEHPGDGHLRKSPWLPWLKKEMGWSCFRHLDPIDEEFRGVVVPLVNLCRIRFQRVCAIRVHVRGLQHSGER